MNMSKIHIMASHVNNLTDARYFASWGTEFIGFCRDFQHIDYCNDDRIRDMIQWLEGPAFLMEFNSNIEEETISTMQQVTGITNIRIPSSLPEFFADYHDFNDNNYTMSEIIISSTEKKYPAITIPGQYSSIPEETWEALKKFSHVQSFFLELNWQSADEVYAINRKFLPYGLIFQGSNEEKTGMKSFDVLDDLLAAIQDLNE